MVHAQIGDVEMCLPLVFGIRYASVCNYGLVVCVLRMFVGVDGHFDYPREYAAATRKICMFYAGSEI